jgi:hypothetical protein
MKLSEFITSLDDLRSSLPQGVDPTVILAKDDEGNEYHQCYGPELSHVRADEEDEWHIDSLSDPDDYKDYDKDGKPLLVAVVVI